MPRPPKHISFFDEIRVNDTIQRFGGSLDKKVAQKTKKATLNPMQIGVAIEETDTVQPLNPYEKLELLKTLLQEHSALKANRPTDKYFDGEFVMERCRAFRVVVPQDAVAGHSTSPLSFWLSPGFQTDGLLCLLEGDGSDTTNPYNTSRCSNYTLLQSLIFFARKQSRAGILDRVIPNLSHPNEYVKVDETHPPSLIETNLNVKKFSHDFIKDPHSLLEQWGCFPSGMVNIEALYRVREFGPEDASSIESISTFAYALSVQVGE